MSVEADRVYRKVALRLLPFLGVCYLAAYLDRVNVGFAKLQMAQDLGLSDAAYGLGAGIFFIGYFLFEVPSNLILHRIGARTWLARIMISWALVSAAMAALGPVHAHFGPEAASYAFAALRFLLGATEAGFFPGVLLYLSTWFPPSRRSLAVGQFLLAQPVAFVLGAPLSGLILARTQGAYGLDGWQWMYVLEAIPAVVLGLWLLRRLDDGLEHAAWLTDSERTLLREALVVERSPTSTGDLRAMASNGAVQLLALAYFLLVLGAYGLNFWLPAIIKNQFGKDDLTIGLLTALPYSVGVVVMLAVAARSRAEGHARSRAAWACALAGLGLGASTFVPGHPWLMMAGMAAAISGYLAANALFWRLPGEWLEGRALAGGLAAINALGNLGGFAGPYLMGVLVTPQAGSAHGLLVLSAALIGAGVVLALGKVRARIST